jgi:hypothetical protein
MYTIAANNISFPFYDRSSLKTLPFSDHSKKTLARVFTHARSRDRLIGRHGRNAACKKLEAVSDGEVQRGLVQTN